MLEPSKLKKKDSIRYFTLPFVLPLRPSLLSSLRRQTLVPLKQGGLGTSIYIKTISIIIAFLKGYCLYMTYPHVCQQFFPKRTHTLGTFVFKFALRLPALLKSVKLNGFISCKECALQKDNCKNVLD